MKISGLDDDPFFLLGWGLTWWELCILSLKKYIFQYIISIYFNHLNSWIYGESSLRRRMKLAET